jgi:hypothetical protein
VVENAEFETAIIARGRSLEMDHETERIKRGQIGTYVVVEGPAHVVYGSGDSVTLLKSEVARLRALGVLVDPSAPVTRIADYSSKGRLDELAKRAV